MSIFTFCSIMIDVNRYKWHDLISASIFEQRCMVHRIVQKQAKDITANDLNTETKGADFEKLNL